MNVCIDCQCLFNGTHAKRCNICRKLRIKELGRESMQRTYFKSEIDKAKKKTERRCMKCNEKFQSEGKHNRMCADCRNLGGSPYES